MDSNTPPHHEDSPPEDSRPPDEEAKPGRGSRPTPEQLEKRKLLQENRHKERERKKRTRELIQMGGVCAAFGFESPEQVEQILTALTRSRKGPERLSEMGVKETDRWPQS